MAIQSTIDMSNINSANQFEVTINRIRHAVTNVDDGGFKEMREVKVSNRSVG